jgi:hypothetical protein
MKKIETSVPFEKLGLNNHLFKGVLSNGFLLPFVSIVLCSLSSCSSAPPAPTEKQQLTTRMGDTSAVEVLDMRSVVRNNLLTAQVTVKNWGFKPDAKGAQQPADTKLYGYRFKWLNDNGMVVFSDEVWKPLTLTRDQSADLVGIAPHPDAAAFRFEINQYK